MENIIVVSVASLDWTPNLPTTRIQCVGQGFISYSLKKKKGGIISKIECGGPNQLISNDGKDSSTSNNESEDSNNCKNDNDSGSNKTTKKPKRKNLLTLSEEKLNETSYYTILNIPMHATADEVRKAYHRACLLYHPDKTGRGKDDHVFLKLKEVFDTLSDVTKRRSYDSTVDFDDSIPKEGVSADKFYKVYGPVFERNLRFAILEDDISTSKPSVGNKKKKRSGVGGNKKKQGEKPPPSLGDDSTPIEDVHVFYEFWTRFRSWRDFTIKATSETEHDVDAAECREEKRWMAKEIERRSRKLKKEEMARISTLVERAMAADPRLARASAARAAESERRKREEEEEAARAAEEEERIRKERLQTEEKEKEERVKAKLDREKAKKVLRKAKQSLRKTTMTLYNSHKNADLCWASLDDLNDEVELLCAHLELEDIQYLVSIIGDEDDVNPDVLPEIRGHVEQLKRSLASNAKVVIEKRNEQRMAELKEQRRVKREKAKAAQWTAAELSALAKGVKKYPPGGSNRWETISLFVNNLCKLENPRNKEECIEAYNRVIQLSAEKHSIDSTSQSNEKEDVWTELQDKQLQEALATHPSTMDKNERWTAISQMVDEKTKKQCVNRFKYIRDALKNNKKT